MTDLIDKEFPVLQQLGTESQIEYVEMRELIEIHDQVVERFGGEKGIRDVGLLESAVNRPMNLSAYEGEDDPLRLAASLAYGVITNHPFRDGNKRTGFMALSLACNKNNIELNCDNSVKINLIRSVAKSEMTEDEFYLNLKNELDLINSLNQTKLPKP